MSAQAMWGGAGVSLMLAVVAGWREYRRRRRADLDRVGAVDWITVQALALIAAALCAYLAWRQPQ